MLFTKIDVNIIYVLQMIVGEVIKEELADIIDDTIEEIEEEEESKRLFSLSDEEASALDTFMNGGPADEILVKKYNVDLTRAHLQCLRPGEWLNDEVCIYSIVLPVLICLSIDH